MSDACYDDDDVPEILASVVLWPQSNPEWQHADYIRPARERVGLDRVHVSAARITNRGNGGTS